MTQISENVLTLSSQETMSIERSRQTRQLTISLTRNTNPVRMSS